MRITLALTILCALVANGLVRTATGVPSSLAAFQAAPAQGPQVETATEAEVVNRAIREGGLLLALLLVLFSYRRDFFRQNEALREEKREQVAVLDKCANAMLAQAVATQVNTEATKLLAQNVNNLADRRLGPRA